MDIQIENLCKRYTSGGKTINALDDVTLTIPANKIFTLLGPSGCGKTTLLRCIVGLESPDSGEIRIGGETVWSGGNNIYVPPEKRGLGMVFQSYAIWPHMTVFDNVAYPLQTRKTDRAEIRRRVAKTLSFVQLEGFEDRPATKLSGGQQQRVALARALVAEPKVILFDEPLSNLDAKLREETRKDLRVFLTELGITAVYVTHDRIEALALSDLIAVMRNGRIIEKGTPRDIYFHSEHNFVADFIGRTNLIDGVVKSREADATTVECPLGEVRCASQADIAPGDKVVLSLRPEFLHIAEDGAAPEDGTANRITGRIDSLVFVGEAMEGEVLVGDTRLFVKVRPDSELKEGDAVSMTVTPAHCLLLTK
ncbi:ABC transporter ATP-binding protein [Pseudodesulfovibrio sp.]|uniref:ABC transporter ATP-binding protein n=1 Tax=Pseudodesulfovibrio sp. TaxID=2035812 RepID=UPI00261F7C89|nr:ABC transporter ATP-binding protein [Pseudodesulfovibrio sp.]MDD3313722.1 ABC transporter ATP-binding protein [Pseudodesulfovibrio sp.]